MAPQLLKMVAGRRYCLAPARRAKTPLRLKTNFLNRIKPIWAVQPSLKKYFCFSEPQIKSISLAVSPHRGAYHDRRLRGVGCDGREPALLTRALAGGRQSRVVLMPRRWHQVRAKARGRRWQESPVAGESTI
jgi:hypothetical protein